MQPPLMVRRAEILILRIALAAFVLDLILILLKGVAVDWRAYLHGAGLAALLAAIGAAYRYSGRDARIGAATTGAGLFIFFTLCLSAFNYLLMPHWSATIDVQLAALDEALFDYHWPDFVAFAGEHPILNEIMRYAYLSTLPQIALLIVVLGMTGRLSELAMLMATVAIGGTLAVIIWGILPSLGPSTLFELPPAIAEAARPVVGSEYGREIAALFAAGADRLSPDEIRGLIAFPSFHIALALASTYFARTLGTLFYLLIIVNLAVIPAVLAHGGHHVLDIPAGFAVFAFALLMARQALAETQPRARTVPGIA